jgi:hypothetical protein
MSKKLLIGLAPLLVTAAFVVMPTMAQAATPHYYVAGVKAKEGTTFPSISWGTLTLANSNPAISPLSCENAVIGDYKNPTGGGPGEAETDNFATTDCADVECPEEEGLELQVHSEGLPWDGGLLGTETGKDLLETKNAIVVVGCYVAHTSTLVAAPTTCKGNSDPSLTNGTGNLSQTVSTVLFTGQSDKLECVSVTESGEVKTEGITEKSLKTMAYGSPVPTKKVEPETANTAQATLETRNP